MVLLGQLDQWASIGHRKSKTTEEDEKEDKVWKQTVNWRKNK